MRLLLNPPLWLQLLEDTQGYQMELPYRDRGKRKQGLFLGLRGFYFPQGKEGTVHPGRGKGKVYTGISKYKGYKELTIDNLGTNQVYEVEYKRMKVGREGCKGCKRYGGGGAYLATPGDTAPHQNRCERTFMNPGAGPIKPHSAILSLPLSAQIPAVKGFSRNLGLGFARSLPQVIPRRPQGCPSLLSLGPFPLKRGEDIDVQDGGNMKPIRQHNERLPVTLSRGCGSGSQATKPQGFPVMAAALPGLGANQVKPGPILGPRVGLTLSIRAFIPVYRGNMLGIPLRSLMGLIPGGLPGRPQAREGRGGMGNLTASRSVFESILDVKLPQDYRAGLYPRCPRFYEGYMKRDDDRKILVGTWGQDGGNQVAPGGI